MLVKIVFSLSYVNPRGYFVMESLSVRNLIFFLESFHFFSADIFLSMGCDFFSLEGQKVGGQVFFFHQVGAHDEFYIHDVAFHNPIYHVGNAGPILSTFLTIQPQFHSPATFFRLRFFSRVLLIKSIAS